LSDTNTRVQKKKKKKKRKKRYEGVCTVKPAARHWCKL
jgi:hypothetical protein